ncbi:MAG: hypothetical protein ACLS3H_12115 [Hominisplanchenecus sp.]
MVMTMILAGMNILREIRVLLYMKKHPEIRKIVEEQIGEPITSIWKDAEV